MILHRLAQGIDRAAFSRRFAPVPHPDHKIGLVEDDAAGGAIGTRRVGAFAIHFEQGQAGTAVGLPQ